MQKRLKSTPKSCNYCHKEFMVQANVLRLGKGKFCSKFCANMDKRVLFACIKCSKEFYRIKSCVPTAKYCSKTCSNASTCNAGGSKRTPEQRRRLVDAHVGQVAWNKGKDLIHLRGENHPRWKGGNKNPYRTEYVRAQATSRWAEWRKSVYERDGYKCLDCGYGQHLEPHHIIPVRSDRSKLFDTNNGITLCRPCHMKTFGRELELAPVYMTLATRAVSAYSNQ